MVGSLSRGGLLCFQLKMMCIPFLLSSFFFLVKENLHDYIAYYKYKEFKKKTLWMKQC